MARRSISTLMLAALMVTCTQSGAPDAPPLEANAGAIVAFDVASLAEPLRESDGLPARMVVRADAVTLGSVLLPAPDGLLNGHVAVAVRASTPVAYELEVSLPDGRLWRSSPVTVDAARDEVVVVPVSATGDRLTVGAERHLVLPVDARALVWRNTEDASPELLSALGDQPTQAVAAILRDPQTSSLVPFSETPSAADEVGALVGLGRAVAAHAIDLEDRPQGTVTSAPTLVPTAMPVEAAVTDESSEKVATPKNTTRVDSAPSARDHVTYFSYCDCGKPVPHRAFTFTSDGGDVLTGKTDAYGFALVRHAADGRIDFGSGSRPRSRAYDYEEAQAANHAPVYAALSSQIVGDRLTALLDLRREPLAPARDTLILLLDTDDRITWHNAAVTLSFYSDLAPLVYEWTDRLAKAETSEAQEKALLVLGGLRHAAAIPAVSPWIRADAMHVREAAAWALGMTGGSADTLLPAVNDAAEPVRDAAVLALGRLGAVDALDRVAGPVQADESDAVQARWTEAFDLAGFVKRRVAEVYSCWH